MEKSKKFTHPHSISGLHNNTDKIIISTATLLAGNFKRLMTASKIESDKKAYIIQQIEKVLTIFF